jgi:hypothetical protein
MIQPDRYTNPDFSVINISSVILEKLIKENRISYDNLLKEVIYKVGDEAKENYPYALNFLFLLGKINYISQNDNFEYLNQ